MAIWHLIDFTDLHVSPGLIGYGVFDALGVRIGRVTGWVTDAQDHVAMLKVSVWTRPKTQGYLVPLGVINRIEDAEQCLYLRQVSKSALTRDCFPVDEVLPADDVLTEWLDLFPNPRPVIIERLENPFEIPAPPQRGRLTIGTEQGDGSRRPPPDPAPPINIPSPAGRPGWRPLIDLAPPDWRPLWHFL